MDDSQAFHSRRGLWVRALLLLVLVIVLYALQCRLDLLQYFTRDRIGSTLEAIRTGTEDRGGAGLFLFALACATAMLVNFPTACIVFLSVTILGRWKGCLLSLAIIGVGFTFIYIVAHTLARPLVQRLLGGRLAALEARLARRELVGVIMLRLVLFMNPVLNWVLGLSAVRYRNLICGTLAGATPGIVLLAWLSGEFLGLLQSGGSLNPLRTPQLLVPLLLAVLLFGVVRRLDRLDRPQAATEAAS